MPSVAVGLPLVRTCQHDRPAAGAQTTAPIGHIGRAVRVPMTYRKGEAHDTHEPTLHQSNRLFTNRREATAARVRRSAALRPVALACVVIGLVATACSSPSDGTTPSVDPATADVTIISRDMAFDRSSITVPAGSAWSLQLMNNEAAPHNVAIYSARDGGTSPTRSTCTAPSWSPKPRPWAEAVPPVSSDLREWAEQPLELTAGRLLE